MGFIPGRFHTPQISVAPQHTLMSELYNAVSSHQVPGQHNTGSRAPNPLRHLIQNTHSTFEKVLEHCSPGYAHDPLFREFANAAGFRIIPYEQYAKEFIALPKPYPDTLPPEFSPEFRARLQGKVYVADPMKCPNTLFGYWVDDFEDELVQAVEGNPYEYYKLYMKTAKEDPERIFAIFGTEKSTVYQRSLRDKVRQMLGATAATDEFAKQIYERHGGDSEHKAPEAGDNGAKAAVDEFKKEARVKMTKEQVEQVAAKYLRSGNGASSKLHNPS